MQALAAAGVPGPALAVFSYGGVGALGLPLLWRTHARWRPRWRRLLLIALLGGWANASFILSLTLGDVVREMLLFYLAPAWSVLGARVALGERVRLRRWLAVALALAGAFLVIRAGGPIRAGTLSVADLLAVSSGLAFAGNNLATRSAAAIPVAAKTVAAMIGCGLLSGLVLLALHEPLAAPSLPAAAGVAAFALLWVAVGSSTTSYGVTHLEAGRAALIILSELVSAVVSASLIKNRPPSALEVAGGLLILCAAAIDGLAA
jgi:drug/metabolite transporter (DMT)-like permease